ncbi:MAG: hypothetical protein AAF901_04130 [Bacteroidota bacterium]
MRYIFLYIFLSYCCFSFSQEKALDEENRTFPVHRGCKKKLSYEEMKKCTTDKIIDYIKVSFDYQMADKVFLTDKTTSFQVDFIINKKGKAEDINAKDNHKAIAIEAIRLITRMPKLRAPGTVDGKPVNTPISLLMTIYFPN